MGEQSLANSLARSRLLFPSFPAGTQRAHPPAERKVTFVAWKGLGGKHGERRNDPSGVSLPGKGLTAVSSTPRKLRSPTESQVGAGTAGLGAGTSSAWSLGGARAVGNAGWQCSSHARSLLPHFCSFGLFFFTLFLSLILSTVSCLLVTIASCTCVLAVHGMLCELHAMSPGGYHAYISIWCYPHSPCFLQCLN